MSVARGAITPSGSAPDASALDDAIVDMDWADLATLRSVSETSRTLAPGSLGLLRGLSAAVTSVAACFARFASVRPALLETLGSDDEERCENVGRVSELL